MIAKSLIAALALAAGLATALPAPEARADVDIDVAIGVGGYSPPAYGTYDAYDGYGYGHGYRRGHVERYRHYDPYYRDEVILYVTCGEGRRILRREGFREVQASNCRGPNYRYTAWKRGKKFDIRLSASGEITRIRRVH